MANGKAARQGKSKVDLFGDADSIAQLNARIAHRAVNLGVTKQQMDGTGGGRSFYKSLRLLSGVASVYHTRSAPNQSQ